MSKALLDKARAILAHPRHRSSQEARSLEVPENIPPTAKSMILTAIGWHGHYSLGKADPSLAAHMIASGRALGFRLAKFRNSTGYITDEHLQTIARARTA